MAVAVVELVLPAVASIHGWLMHADNITCVDAVLRHANTRTLVLGLTVRVRIGSTQHQSALQNRSSGCRQQEETQTAAPVEEAKETDEEEQEEEEVDAETDGGGVRQRH